MGGEISIFKYVLIVLIIRLFKHSEIINILTGHFKNKRCISILRQRTSNNLVVFVDLLMGTKKTVVVVKLLCQLEQIISEITKLSSLMIKLITKNTCIHHSKSLVLVLDSDIWLVLSFLILTGLHIPHTGNFASCLLVLKACLGQPQQEYKSFLLPLVFHYSRSSIIKSF